MKNLYTVYNRTRLKKFQIKTCIVDENGVCKVSKIGLSSESRNHIEDIYNAYELISKNKKTDNLKLPKILDKSQDSITYEYVEGKTLDRILFEMLLKDDKDNFIRILKEYESFLVQNFTTKSDSKFDFNPNNIFGEIDLSLLKEQKNILGIWCVDLIFSNFILKKDDYYLVDHEWVYEGNIPLSFVIFRSISVFYWKYGDFNPNKLFQLEDLLEDFGIDLNLKQLYLQMEKGFQWYVHQNIYEINNYLKSKKSLNDLFQNEKSSLEVICKLEQNVYEKELQIKRDSDRINALEKEICFYKQTMFYKFYYLYILIVKKLKKLFAKYKLC